MRVGAEILENAPTKLAYSVRGAAEAASLSERNLWFAIKAGKLRTLKVGGRVLIATDDLKRFLGIETESK